MMRRFLYSSSNSNLSVESFFDRWRRYKRGEGSFTQVAMQAIGQEKDWWGYRWTYPQQVFANSDLSLSTIDAYGFDHDYTLAHYRRSLESLIYDLGIEALIEDHGYPRQWLENLKFSPDFAVRGIHYDTNNGFLFKLDQHNKIQPDTVMLGRRKLTLREVVREYNGLKLSRRYGEQSLKMMTDMFSLPEACLIADVIDVFMRAGWRFHPLYVLNDVANAIYGVHASGKMHRKVIEAPHMYLDKNGGVGELLLKLRRAGKKTFLLSNSSLAFIDAGLRYQLSEFLVEHNIPTWRDLFDIVIVSANKPDWYSRDSPFRRVDPESGVLMLKPVRELKHGRVYSMGSKSEFHRLTGLPNDTVLFFGDQIYADLKRPQKMATWKTVAVLRELEREIEVMNSPGFVQNLGRLEDLDRLLQFGQLIDDESVRKLIPLLQLEGNQLRQENKICLNPYFGSSFRTYNTRTMFFYNVGRYADLYCSNICNFQEYPVDFTFVSKRSIYPHESDVP